MDKSLLIKDLLDKKSKVNLFTRPRRFGKTLNLSMLKYFFEDMRNIHGEKKDNRTLFEGLKIMEAGERYTSELGQYPVINMTLKYIFEFKCAKKAGEMERLAEAALDQIEEKGYEAELSEQGYSKIEKYGICFFRKDCVVRKEKE